MLMFMMQDHKNHCHERHTLRLYQMYHPNQKHFCPGATGIMGHCFVMAWKTCSKDGYEVGVYSAGIQANLSQYVKYVEWAGMMGEIKHCLLFCFFSSFLPLICILVSYWSEVRIVHSLYCVVLTKRCLCL